MRSTVAATSEEPSSGCVRLAEEAQSISLLYTKVRRVPERLFAISLFVVSLPLQAVIYALVRVTSKGPGIYRQTRVGRGGQQFVLYKFRTMRVDAEAGSGPVWSQPGDDRVTPIGKFLRWSHLDELPQLVNVMAGHMSLIGPRPERPEFTEVLSQQIPGYLSRLNVPPGITGLAQVILPADSTVESVKEKLALDLEYIRRASPWLDLQILFCTGLRLVGVRNWFAKRILMSSSNRRAGRQNHPDAIEEAVLIGHSSR